MKPTKYKSILRSYDSAYEVQTLVANDRLANLSFKGSYFSRLIWDVAESSYDSAQLEMIASVQWVQIVIRNASKFFV